jgi:subtilisin family serine protease
MIGDTKIKKAIIATLFTMLMATTAAYATWWYIKTFKGGEITVVGTVFGTVYYSYNNNTWRTGDLTVNLSDPDTDELWVMFNVTHIPEQSMTLLFNFRLYCETDGNNVTTVSVQQTFSKSDLPKAIYANTNFATYMQIDKQYTVYVDIYKWV